MKQLFWVLTFVTVLIWGAYDEMREVHRMDQLPVAVVR